ncbi:Hypothetical protein CINCED_3A000982, partial [Cinara cedri]
KVRKKRIIVTKKTTTEEDKKNNKLHKKNKQKERKQTLEQEIDNNVTQDDIKQIYTEDLEIVDIAKPLGKWTKMVMQNGGLMLRFAQLIKKNEGGQKGFWQLFVEAQSSTKSKNRGQGR